MEHKYKGRNIFVIAHRGGGELFKENTISAFTGVEKLGVDAVECDVQVSKDGSLVVMHDPDLLRTAGIDKKIEDLNTGEIKNVTLKDGEHIPLLEDVLNSIHIPVMIELKSMETVKSITELFTVRPELLKRSVLISFFHDALLMMKQRFPEVTCGALIAGFPVDPVALVKKCGCDTIAINYEGLTRPYVDRCHNGGIRVSVWTPNDVTSIKSSLDAGVDVIASDRPDLVIKLLDSL